MQKIIFFILFGMSSLLHAQRIELPNGSNGGSISKEGTFRATNNSVNARISGSTGRLEDSSGHLIGYITDDGKIQNSGSATIGTIDDNGTVRNSSLKILGYVDKNGTVRNAQNVKIGTAENVKPAWAAAKFFFFDGQL